MSTLQGKKESQSPDDRWIFRLIYPLMILGVVHIGNDNTIERLLSMPSYYSDLLLATVCTYGAGYYFRLLFRTWERRCHWEEDIVRCLLKQLKWGVWLPLTIIIAVELYYLIFFLHIPVSRHTIWYLELPLILVFLLMINLIYFLLYHRKHHIQMLQTLDTDKTVKHDHPYLLVSTGAKTRQIPYPEVGYFIKQDGITFLHLRSGDVYVYDLPLDRILEHLDGKTFFQLNRQVIASRHTIRSYSATATRKLKIELQPTSPHPVFVSKARASAFIRWFDPVAVTHG